MMSRFLAATLAALLVLTLPGCGGSAPDAQPKVVRPGDGPPVKRAGTAGATDAKPGDASKPGPSGSTSEN